MKIRELKAWKKQQEKQAGEIADTIRQSQKPLSILNFYPEFHLESPYTTALDGYAPLWSQLPLFRMIVVGIAPYLKTPKDFLHWYGLWPNQVLELSRQGKIAVRILFPSGLDEIPDYLDPFFNEGAPSTLRDYWYNRLLLAGEQEEVKQRFAQITTGLSRTVSIDKLSDDRGRAYRTAETVFFQLWSLGYHNECQIFETIFKKDQDLAFDWLECCRLFLVGPIHYSLEGMHSVSAQTRLHHHKLFAKVRSSALWDAELGIALVKEIGLISRPSDAFGLQECLKIYPRYEKARNVLLSLVRAVEKGGVEPIQHATEFVKDTLTKGKRQERNWLVFLRILGYVGLTAATTQMSGWQGLLASIGLVGAGELLSERVNRIVQPVADYLRRRTSKSHVVLLLDLAKDSESYFKGLGARR